MELAEQDRIEITDLINLHGHLTDAGELDRAGELFTPDVTYDLADFGLSSLHGTAALREAALALGDANPVGHHITNIVIAQIDEHSARVRSKGIGVKADGTAGSVVYDDIVTRRPDGWKISHRTVSARRAALGKREAGPGPRPGSGSGPREVLEQCRQAAINQSVDDLRRVYAADAVHEFPFTLPGVPARLEGRDEIVNWIAAGWKANPLRYERYRTLAVHDTGDPETIIVEQEALGTSASTGEFTLPNIVVLTARNGQIAHLRDYLNTLAAAALGHDIQPQPPAE
jgi:ketosteroid isomerase-like protein